MSGVFTAQPMQKIGAWIRNPVNNWFKGQTKRAALYELFCQNPSSCDLLQKEQSCLHCGALSPCRFGRKNGIEGPTRAARTFSSTLSAWRKRNGSVHKHDMNDLKQNTHGPSSFTKETEMTPTAEQAAIIEAALTTSESLIINALAGAAKTSTLEMICRALPVQPILSLAFNKKIALEMEKRLPGHVKCATLNSIGHGVWAQATGRRLIVDTKKTYTIIKSAIETLPKRQQGEAYTEMSEAIRLVGTMKSSGYIPPGVAEPAKSLLSRQAFLDSLEEDPSDTTLELAESALATSIRDAYAGNIDFDDQIYMSTLFGGTFPRFPLVLVDEAQDLSALNHAMLRKLVTKRLIAVGDPWQSIYGFRGAVSNGMSTIAEAFACREMTLSISFRCPAAVVREANKRVPHMQPRPGAPEGLVESLDSWTTAAIPENAVILCRNNAPLFKIALELIKRGRGVSLPGMDIGPRLVKTLRALGPVEMLQDQVHAQIDKWETETMKKPKGRASVADRAECLHVFADAGPNLAAAIAYAEHLFKATGPIQLMSGHKSKGLEFPVVYHLDSWRIPGKFATSPEALEQEKNIAYVIATRAKEALYFINVDGLVA